MIRSWGQKRDEDKGVSQRQTNAGEALRLPPLENGFFGSRFELFIARDSCSIPLAVTCIPTSQSLTFTKCLNFTCSFFSDLMS